MIRLDRISIIKWLDKMALETALREARRHELAVWRQARYELEVEAAKRRLKEEESL